jgi:hypothetical protein
MYKCTDTFFIDTVDDEGFSLEDEQMTIPKGSIWNLPEEDYRFIGGEIRLESDKHGWIEITNETLEQHFVKIT